ncbi:cell division protein FtsQ/DivIB [Phaeovulum sp. NW3]|uniref:cell division protein FtsQ/DivIB n=1 Tax=Phaeovulum sp. NW3 TaxID=2934933 RepID=UPI00201FC7D8|nr:cell division protein FtsQ/DivIB [Phaeovulum sp. NW3]MCL7464403.1 cell division protein FtsQ/DivIB [Phaeovulum sp. NW3]
MRSLGAPPPRPQLRAEPRPGAAPRAPQMAAAAPRPPRRDPAPSRLAYRLQRLWLTPFVRALTRIGLPVFAVVLGLGIWLGDEGRRADLVASYEDIKLSIQNRPEFMVGLLKIEGASPEVDAAIRAMMPVQLPASSFAIDLDAFRAMIRRLDAVADVGLMIRPGGVLEAAVTERVPAILWRAPTGLEMLDATGHRVATLIARETRPDLALIAGVGADRAVPEALAVLAAAAPILPRARGLVRVGERRWDLVLERDQRILLPEQNPVRAIERVLALDAAEDILDRDFTHLDMRNETRPTIRLSAAALEEFRRITGPDTKARAVR